MAEEEVPPKVNFVRSNKCYSFAWSLSLWRSAAFKILGGVAVGLPLYLCAAYLLAHQKDGLGGVDSWYLISATIMTVGLGDVSPSSPMTRSASLVMLPLGLFFLSFLIAATEAWGKAQRPKVPSDSRDPDAPLVRLSVEEQLKLNEEENRAVGRATRAAALKLAAQYALVIAMGAAFYRSHARERRLQEERAGVDMTFVDALYFSTVMATSVGYGHEIINHSDGAKRFAVGYMVVATIVVGAILKGVSTLMMAHHERAITEVCHSGSNICTIE